MGKLSGGKVQPIPWPFYCKICASSEKEDGIENNEYVTENSS